MRETLGYLEDYKYGYGLIAQVGDARVGSTGVRVDLYYCTDPTYAPAFAARFVNGRGNSRRAKKARAALRRAILDLRAAGRGEMRTGKHWPIAVSARYRRARNRPAAMKLLKSLPDGCHFRPERDR